MDEKATLEETTEIKQANRGVPKLLLLLFAVITITCISYFFTHITRS